MSLRFTVNDRYDSTPNGVDPELGELRGAAELEAVACSRVVTASVIDRGLGRAR